MPGRGGRPTKLTRQIINEVRRLMPRILYLEIIGDYLAVSRQTWRGWVRRGRKEQNRIDRAGGQPLKAEALYLEFFTTYKKELARGAIDHAENIEAAGKKQWQASAWFLERRFPGHFGDMRKDFDKLKKEFAAVVKETHELTALLQAARAAAGGAAPPAAGQHGESSG